MLKKVLEWLIAGAPGVPMLAGVYIAFLGGRADLQVIGGGIAVWTGIALFRNVIKLLKAKVGEGSS